MIGIPNLRRISLNSISEKPLFTIGNYRFLRLVGKGGFAEVYLVQHIQFNQELCAKVINIDSDSDEKEETYNAEAESLIQLNHPNVIRLYDHFKQGNHLYLILEFCSNGSLQDEIILSNGLLFDRFIYVGAQITSALTYCHSKGIAHCDIKPENVLLDVCRKPKISDFGLSIHTTPGTLCRQFGGSCLFSAPEIFQRKPHDPMASDVWALGVMFIIMITGKTPWDAESLGRLKRQASLGAYTFKKEVPEVIKQIVSRMIVVDPEQRITMGELSAHPLFGSAPIPKQIHLAHTMPYSKSQPWNVVSSHSQARKIQTIAQPSFVDPALRSLKCISTASGMIHPTKKRVSKRKSQIFCSQNLLTFSGFEDTILVVSELPLRNDAILEADETAT